MNFEQEKLFLHEYKGFLERVDFDILHLVLQGKEVYGIIKVNSDLLNKIPHSKIFSTTPTLLSMKNVEDGVKVKINFFDYPFEFETLITNEHLELEPNLIQALLSQSKLHLCVVCDDGEKKEVIYYKTINIEHKKEQLFTFYEKYMKSTPQP
ncbi:MAG: hypothetical protein ACOCQR_01430 [bacterium]